MPAGAELKGLADILAPQWKGKACLANPLFGTTSMHAPATDLRKVVPPWLTPAVLVAGVVAALLATAEIGTVLLLHPLDSLPLAIFTVMANAPESLVAALCLFYFGGATVCAPGLGL